MTTRNDPWRRPTGSSYRADMTRQRAGQIGAIVAAVLLATACSGEAVDAGTAPEATADGAAAPTGSDTDESETETDAPEAPDAGESDTDGSGAGGGPTETDLATGWVLVENTEYPLTGGQCQFLRLDGQEVLDLRADEVAATIAVDSTGGDGRDEDGDVAMRSGSNTFDLEGDVSGSGSWTSVAEAAWTPLRENARLAEVGFIGTLDDGRPVTASVICLVEW